MSHEDRALAALDAAVTSGLNGVAATVAVLVNDQKRWSAQLGMGSILQSTVGIIMALENLSELATDAKTACRAALAEAMSLGLTTVRTDHHVASLRAATKRVIVMDEAALPAHLMHQPPPAPDLTAIGKLLRAGETVPGAVLSNGGADTLQIRTRKDTT